MGTLWIFTSIFIAAIFTAGAALAFGEMWAKDWAKKRGFPRKTLPGTSPSDLKELEETAHHLGTYREDDRGGLNGLNAESIIVDDFKEQGRPASKKLNEFRLIFSSSLDLWRGVVRLCKNLENLKNE